MCPATNFNKCDIHLFYCTSIIVRELDPL